MFSGFCFIRRLEEISNGLLATLDGAPTCLLRNDHREFSAQRELLSLDLDESRTKSQPLPSWVKASDSGDIEEVRLVACGVPLSATSDDAGGHWIVFPFTNCSIRLRADHARFGELEGFPP